MKRLTQSSLSPGLLQNILSRIADLKGQDLRLSAVQQQVVADIYDAALDETRWHHVLQRMSQLVGSECGALRLIDSDISRVCHYW